MTGPRAVREPPALWFEYSPDRKSEHPANHLPTFRGTLQADGYAGFRSTSVSVITPAERGDHRHPPDALRGVRQGVTAVLLAALVTACSGGGGAGTEASPPRCTPPADVGVPLAIRLSARPAVGPAPICPLVSYQSVFATSAWGAMPKELREVDPDVRVWQERSLLYTCERCDAAASGCRGSRSITPNGSSARPTAPEIHDEHPGWVLLDFGDAGYRGPGRCASSRASPTADRAGVDVADAGDAPEWSGTPIDPRTGASPRGRGSGPGRGTWRDRRARARPPVRGSTGVPDHSGSFPASATSTPVQPPSVRLCWTRSDHAPW